MHLIIWSILIFFKTKIIGGVRRIICLENKNRAGGVTLDTFSVFFTRNVMKSLG